MKAKGVIGALVLSMLAFPVGAQTVSDDVRCLLLSNLFAKAGSTDQARRVATQAKAFYLGRIDGRLTQAALVQSLRQQGANVNSRSSGLLMNACIARIGRAEQSIQAAGRTVAPSAGARHR